MSRSIHTTRRDVARALRESKASGGRLDALVAELVARKSHKRAYRRATLASRKANAPNLPIDASSIPITFDDAGPMVHYAVTEADVRAVLGRLPSVALHGVHTIRFTDGVRTQPRRGVADPLIGRRHSTEIIPGVYVGFILGQYFIRKQDVRVYGFVHRDLDPTARRWSLLLKLWSLATLVHELAHHGDHTTNQLRRQPRFSDRRAEKTATHREALWVRDHVVPYLQAQYPEAVRTLKRWIARHSGATLPLSAVAGDWRWDAQGTFHVLHLGSGRSAVTELITQVHARVGALEARRTFAFHLEMADFTPEALTVVDGALAHSPLDTDLRTQRAGLLLQLGQPRDALLSSLPLLAENPYNTQAHLTRLSALVLLQDWPGLEAAATAALLSFSSNSHADGYANAEALLHRAVALLQLGRFVDMECDLAELESHPACRAASVAALRVRVLLVQGHIQEALATTEAALSQRPPPDWRRILTVARWHTRRLLGETPDRRDLPPAILHHLRSIGFPDWAAEIEALLTHRA